MDPRKTRKVVRWSIVAAVPFLFIGCWSCMISMPGSSWSDPLPEITESQRALASTLRAHVEVLAGKIGERNLFLPSGLAKSVEYIESRFMEAGLRPARQEVDARQGRGFNVEAEIRGTRTPGEIVLVGAHYDSAPNCPGANDNGTGVAALLSLAAEFSKAPQPRTLRFVAFVNEEVPFFETPVMGSRATARACAERGDRVVAMLSLETIGCYSDQDGSQRYPFPVGLLYPSKGNFIAFVGNIGSRSLVRRAVSTFRAKARFPSEGAALPSWLPGVGWSDHAPFWREGYAAIMVTDTAPFRYAHYHEKTDTVDKIDFDRCARVVDGLRSVIQDLATDF